jgi:hypothetical protein
MHACRVLVVGVLAAVLWSWAVAGACPTEPTASWVYPYLYELRLREATGRFFVSTGPYGRLETAAWLGEQRTAEPGTRSAWLYRMLETEFRDETKVLRTGSGWAGDLCLDARARTDTKVEGEMLGRLAYYSPLGVCFWSSIRTSVNAPELHKVETRTWGDRARASVDYAGLAFRRNGFSISLARDEVSWGADRRAGLLFSGTAPVLDMFSVAYRKGRVGFTSLHSRLRGGVAESPDDSVRRFVAAHRLEFLPTDRISFSVSEAVIYGGPHRMLEPVYLNPLTIFYAGQWNSAQNDNILISGDFSILFPEVAEVSVEVMIDDFQYDFGTEPHEFAAAACFAAVNPLASRTSMIGTSYYHVRNQTYGHFIEWNRFVHEGQVMGYPDGPDGDSLEIWLTLATPEDMLWKVDYSLKRRGEGRATDVQATRGPHVEFPSGTVESSHRTGLELAWRPSHAYLVSARADYCRTQNSGHRAGVDESGWELTLNVRCDLKLMTWLGG